MPDRSMYTLLAQDKERPTPLSPRADAWAEFGAPKDGGRGRATRRVLYVFVLVEVALLALACLGGVYLVRLHVTGSLRALPSYSPDQIRDAGWMRPLAILEPPTHPSQHSYAPPATGNIEMFNLSSHPATAASLHLLILTPLTNSAKNLPRLFAHLDSLQHPRSNTSLGFLVGDEDDSTGADLRDLVEARRRDYRKITLLSHSFGLELPRGESRHLKSVQQSRRCVVLAGRRGCCGGACGS